MALGVDDTICLILDYLESDHDPNEVRESLPYAAWRRLCIHAAADFSAAHDIFAVIISKQPAVKRSKPCSAHSLVAELVLALEASTVQDIDTAAALQPVLASTASALLSSPNSPMQSAQIQPGIQMLNILFSSCSSFIKYAAGHPAVVAGMGYVLHCAEPPEVSTALRSLIEKLLAASECRTAFPGLYHGPADW